MAITAPSRPTMKKVPRRQWKYGVIAIIVLGIIGIMWYYQRQFAALNERLAESQEAVKTEQDTLTVPENVDEKVTTETGDLGTSEVAEEMKLIEAVRKLVVIPSNESPKVEKIKDIGAITTNKEFFAEAQNGDVVLVFRDAKKAVLYRPATNQIVNIGPVQIASPTPAPPTPTVDPAASVVAPPPGGPPVEATPAAVAPPPI